jgi:TPR repeat protein
MDDWVAYMDDPEGRWPELSDGSTPLAEPPSEGEHEAAIYRGVVMRKGLGWLVLSMKKETPDGSKMRATKKATAAGARPSSGHQITKAPGLLRTIDAREGVDKRYQAALKIMNKGGEVEKAYRLLSSASDDGDANAQYALGTWYLHGFFIKKSLRRAIELLRKAAEANVSSAAFDLAVCYELGQGVSRNINKAAALYLRSFLLGDIDAAVELERVLYWERNLNFGRNFSKEIGRHLATLGK